MCLVKTHAITQSPFLLLLPAERQTLQAICGTLLPALTLEEDDQGPFALRADRRDVVDVLEQSLMKLDPAQQQQLRTLLQLLEQPFFIVLLVGKLNGFSRLAQDDRTRVLGTLAVSRLEKLRMGFQAVKRLTLFIFYSTTEIRAA